MTIETNKVEDLRVYGSQIVDYAISGESGKCFSDVLAVASMQQAYAIENVSMAISAVVELQQEKVRELGDALAVLVASLGSIPTKERTSSSKSCFCSAEEMYAMQATLKKYGYDLELESDGQGTYGKLEPMRNTIQTAVDTESNNLQRTMTTLDGLLKKRDNSFQSTSKIIDKNNRTAKTTIKSMGM